MLNGKHNIKEHTFNNKTMDDYETKMEHMDVSTASVLGAYWLLPGELSDHYVPYLSPLPIAFPILFSSFLKKRTNKRHKMRTTSTYIATNYYCFFLCWLLLLP